MVGSHVTSATIAPTPQSPPHQRQMLERKAQRTHAEVDDSDDDVIAPGTLFTASKRTLLMSSISYVHRMIRRDDQAMESMAGNSHFAPFREDQYHHNKARSRDLDPFRQTLEDGSAIHVTEFILAMLHRGDFDVAEFIMSLLYLTKFLNKTGIVLHVSGWRTLFVVALLLADKMWEDKSVKNCSLTTLFPVLSNSELFELEMHFYRYLDFSAWITKSEFHKFCETLKLGESALAPEISFKVSESEYAKILNEEAAAASKKLGVKSKSSTRAAPQQAVQQPWSARKTVHLGAQNQASGRLSARPTVNGGVAQGHTYVNAEQRATCQAVHQYKSMAEERRTCSEPRVVCALSASGGKGATSPSAGRRCGLEGGSCAANAVYSPSGAMSPREGTFEFHQERRNYSEPRIAPMADASRYVVNGMTCMASSGAASSMAAAVRGSHIGSPSPSGPATHSDPSALSFKQKHELFAGSGGDRCSSEPACSARATLGQPRLAGGQSGTNVAAAGSGTTPHQSCRSASTTAPAARPQLATSGHRSGYPMGHNIRNTMPVMGSCAQAVAAAQKTARAGPLVTSTRATVPVPGDFQRPVMQGSVAGGRQAMAGGLPASNSFGQGLLGRGRSSTRADGSYVAAPLARQHMVPAAYSTAVPSASSFGGASFRIG